MSNTPFAARLRKLMRVAQMTLDDLAAAAGRPVEVLAPVVAGDRLPSGELAEACDRAVDGNGRLRRLARLPQVADLVVKTPFLLRPPKLHGRDTLYGRDEELGKVVDALGPAPADAESGQRTFLLRGPAGIGKTALGIHAAARLKGRFAHGCLYEDLGVYREPSAEGATAEALDRLLRGLGVASRYIPRTLADRATLFKEFMANREVLLIVDGLTSPEQVEFLLPETATASALFIGRDISGNSHVDLELALPPLAETPALELLNASGRLDLTDAGTLDVARWVLRRCGSRPLTLRLLGGCIAVRGRASLDELDHRLASAAQGEDDVTLEEVTDACMAVLPPTYRHTVESLAFHPGDHISRGAAASLTGGSRLEAEADLGRLFSSGFLEHNSENSWHFPGALIDRLRSTASTSASTVARGPALLRLFDHYVQAVAAADLRIAPSRHRFPLVRLADGAAAEDFAGKDEAQTWMWSELDNLLPVATAMYAVAKEGEPAGDLTARQADDVGVACWQFAYAARGYLFATKPWRIWVGIYRLGLDAAYRNQSDRLAHGLMLANLGMALGEVGDLAEARRRQNSARWAFDEAGDEYGATNAIHNEAWLHYYSAQYGDAHNLAMKARRFYRFRRNAYSEAIALDCMARSLLALGKTADAVHLFQQTLKKGRPMFAAADLAQIESHLGEALFRQERYGAAEKAFRRARRLSVAARSLADEAVAIDGLAEVARKLGAIEKAEYWENLADRAYLAFGTGDPGWQDDRSADPEISPASAVTAPPPPEGDPEDLNQEKGPGPRILAIDTDWVSVHGGLTTFNRRLCVALAEAGAEVYCLVANSSAQDRDRAAEQKVRLLQARRNDDDTVREALMRRPRGFPADVVPDLVIGHGRITGRIAECQKEDHYPSAARLHFIHMSPEETEWFKPDLTDVGLGTEIRGKLERQLAIGADLAFAVGPKLHDDFGPQLRGSGVKLRQVDPGFDDAPAHCGPPPTGTSIVLVSGRLHDEHVKGLDTALRAAGQAHDIVVLERLNRFQLVLRGAEETDHAALVELARNPLLQVVPRRFVTDEKVLRDELASASLLLMPSRGEGFGLVGAEAIVAGVPVLVSAESGLGLLLERLAPDLAPKFVVRQTGYRDHDNSLWAERIVTVLRDVHSAFADAAELRQVLAAQRTWAEAANYVLRVARRRTQAAR